MALRIGTTRASFTLSHSRLNRARRLFVWLTRHEIEDVITLQMVADAMIQHGLYWPGATTEEIAYSIIRRLYHVYFGSRSYDGLVHWWAWMQRFQWCGKGASDFNEDRVKAAAKVYPFKKLPWQR